VAILDYVKYPRDVRKLSRSQLPDLVREVRERLIDVVAQVGGHFGGSLGVAELTVALHYVFDTPRDRIVWDTGHQAYIHKILTGRNDRLQSIRRKDGLAPFLRRVESDYDVFGAGHAATSISAAVGMAIGRDHKDEDFDVVAVIGDGAIGCGLAYEALNNAGASDRDLIVVLNDNDMSIAPNVGAMNKYLNGVITNPLYNRVREQVSELMRRVPTSIADVMQSATGRFEESVKHLFVPGMLFEELGFRYFGPFDGHDIHMVVNTLQRVRRMRGPVLIHLVTQKGKGYKPAEADPVKWHASSPWDKITGLSPKKPVGLPRYQKVFGRALTDLAAEDARVVAISAAMPSGTSTDIFGQAFPERFFDVGIAEAHGVTSAAGMATEGVRPVVAIYSTFLQRAFDSILHDVALQNLPVMFCMDRAGVAGADGPTHHGAFDIAYMLLVPGMTVTAPKDGEEFIGLMKTGLSHDAGPYSIRYPRDAVPAAAPPTSEIAPVPYGSWEVLRRGSGMVILAVGTMVLEAIAAADELAAGGIAPTVVNCRFLKPFDEDVLQSVLRSHTRVLTVEEGTVVNGFGAFMSREIQARAGSQVSVRTMGLPDDFIEHGDRPSLLGEVGLDAKGIAGEARRFAEGMAGIHMLSARASA
jgi:1-deoxy-D-xylulose-5-phosphate synthase